MSIITMRGIAAAIACLSIAASGVAQFPIGHGTAVGAYSPSLFSEPLWLGNASFGFQIVGAPPGGTALLAVSSGRQDQTVAGLQIYLDLANVLAFFPASVDATGFASIPFPLPGPDVVSLSGSDFYAQAAVSEPGSGGLGSTQGLLLEVAHHPLLAFATIETGLILLDPLLGTVTPVPAFPGGVFYDFVFGNGGKDLFVATNAGLFALDTLSLTVTPLAQLGALTSLAWDRVYNRLFAHFSVFGTVWIIDGDRSHPTFGTILGQTGMASGSAVGIALSADGRLLAVANNAGSLDRFNVDPTSPGYLSPFPTPTQVPFTPGAVVNRVVLSPDGRVASVVLSISFPTPATTVYRFDGLTGQWLDYSLAPGFQALSASTVPGVPAAFGVLPARDGTHWILTSTTSVVRLDFDLNAPLSAVASPTPMAPVAPNRTYLGLSPSGRYLVQRDWTPFSGPSPNVISLVEIATAGVTPWSTLMGMANSTATAIAAWR